VSSNAVAAKLRQLLPALQAHLNSKGLDVASIRIKVQNR
jgi:ethanolamine ammonia-lyase small subunit